MSDSSDTSIAVIEEQADRSIRREWHDGKMYFSVIDVIAVLTDSGSPRKYWFDMKRRITDEGFVEVSAKCRQLKMTAADGKQRETDAADTDTLLRIVQSVPSPKAEPIKQWLARIGAQHLQESFPEPAPPASASLGSAIAEEWRHQPMQEADSLVWAEYLERLAALYRRQAQFESRLHYVEATTRDHEEQLVLLERRIESLEEGNRTLPELLERLGPERMKPEHQALVRQWVQELQQLTGQQGPLIYDDLHTDFQVARFSDIHESDWGRIEEWFKIRIDAARQSS